MERLEPEHFLNAVPGYGFGFTHDDAEQNTGYYKFNKFHV